MRIENINGGANFGSSLIIRTRNKSVLNKLSSLDFFDIASIVEVKGVPSKSKSKLPYRRILLDGPEKKSLRALEELNRARNKYETEYANLLNKIIANSKEIEVDDIRILRGLRNCKSVKGILASIERFAKQLPK